MEQQKETGYKIETILLLESTFSRKPDISFDGTPFDNQINIEREITDATEQGKFMVSVTLTFEALQDQVQAFYIKVKMAGLFEMQGEPQLAVDTFKAINAPAIIYPFVREHVSSLTLKAGIGSLLLPAVNFKI